MPQHHHFIGEDARDGVADKYLDGYRRVVIGRIAGQRFHAGDELIGFAMLEGGGNAYLDGELVRPMSFAVADAFDFRRMPGIDPRHALTLLLLARAALQQ